MRRGGCASLNSPGLTVLASSIPGPGTHSQFNHGNQESDLGLLDHKVVIKIRSYLGIRAGREIHRLVNHRLWYYKKNFHAVIALQNTVSGKGDS